MKNNCLQGIGNEAGGCQTMNGLINIVSVYSVATILFYSINTQIDSQPIGNNAGGRQFTNGLINLVCSDK